MTQEPCESTLCAWTRLVRAHQAAMSRVERALKAADLPPLDWYDVLVELERAGELRPAAVHARAGAAPAAVRAVAPPGADGGGRARRALELSPGRPRPVRRADRRGPRDARADGAGLCRAVQEAVGARLAEAEAEALAELLGRLA